VPVFNKEAYLAACRNDLKHKEINQDLPLDTFDTNESLEEALNRLSDEQCCDALYADYLMSLNGVDANTVLAIRNLVIGKGALAANYLAELAQNADDASDGKQTSVKIALEGNWLLFGNDGRKITVGNLHGLTRFFTHNQPINEETIGKFGIGFKSCYRLATEVFVYTWDKDGAFAFRLPICDSKYPDSYYDKTRLARIVENLKSQGVAILKSVCEINKLGYCTPEYIEALPDDITSIAAEFTKSERGTLFCLHLHENGREDVSCKIKNDSIFQELCPLFLPSLTSVMVEQGHLKVNSHKLRKQDCIENILDAHRVTIVKNKDGKKENQRQWIIEGKQPNDVWKIALNADSDYRIIKPIEDQVLSMGGTYAFFHLNAASKSWPINMQLHINMSTNLARDDWNPSERNDLIPQIKQSAKALAKWIDKSENKLHCDWSIHDLFQRQPDKGSYAELFYTALNESGKDQRIHKTLWGTQTSKQNAVSLAVSSASGFKACWSLLSEFIGTEKFEHNIIPAYDHIDFDLVPIDKIELQKLFDTLTTRACADAEYWQSVFLALLSLVVLPQYVDRILKNINVEKSNGQYVDLYALFQQRAGADLIPAWHDTFKKALNWCDQRMLATNICSH